MKTLICCWAIFLSAHPIFSAEKPRVLATFAPIHCFAKNVAGDAADVEMLLPPNAGPHDFALSPSDLRKIARADVIVANGLGLEAWLDKAMKSSGKKATRINSSDAVIPETKEPPNPHIWLDPILAIKQVENIRDGLMKINGANAETYRRNAARYTEKLRALDQEIRNVSEKLPNKRLVTFHDTFPYFASRYGFKIVAVFEPFPGKEPTPKYLRQLRAAISQHQVRVLFSEPQFSPKLLRTISKETGARIVELDPLESGEPSAELYEKVMRTNLVALKKALDILDHDSIR